MEPILNRDLLPHNDCFGCGLENTAGLRIEIRRDATLPGPLRGPFTPTGSLRHQAGARDSVVVHTEARRADGELCVEAEFKVVPLSRAKLRAVAGIPELPANWQTFLSGAA